MAEIIHLSSNTEQTAYHEAGHAAIELIYGFTPQLLLIKNCDGQVTGECFSCSPIGKEHAAWHGEKAVAGVLAQAMYLAGQRLGLQSLSFSASAISDMVNFFSIPPDEARSCVIPIVDNNGVQTCQVDLRSFYSEPDFFHFRTAIVELTEHRIVGRKFSGNEPECRPAAEQCVLRCVNYLNDTFVWRQLSDVANKLINSQPVTVHLIGRDGIENAARMLWNFHEKKSMNRN